MKVVRKNKLIFIVSLIVLIITSLITFFSCMLITPKIKLIDNNLITIDVGTEYIEPGYEVYLLNKDISNNVKIKENVNINKLGKYLVEYKVTFGFFSDKKVRMVKVVDRESPVIKLRGDKKVSLCLGKTYQEDGYEVFDNYDKELNVNRIEKDNKVYYEAVDSSGNKVTEIREIVYMDDEKPNIILKGNQTEYLYLNDVYKESGYQATDNCDGDITSKVKVSGKVDTATLGTYKITYQASDSSGNTVSITRSIVVRQRAYNKSGVIYLTFDDGPSSTITSKVLDILKSEGVQATFFVVGKSDNLNYLIKREYDEGHTVALHSYTHNYAKIYQSSQNYFNDLKKIQDKVKRITGVESKIIRFPGGGSNTVSRQYRVGIMSDLTKEVLRQGYHYFDWNVSSGDAGDVRSSEQVYRNVINGLSINRANIVLMHDFENNYYTLNALQDIIRYAKANGYKFSKITMDTGMVTHKVQN